MIDEWIFVVWTPDGGAGVISGHRLIGTTAWYWSAHVRKGYPLLHLAEWEVRRRRNPMVVKAPEMWAEHTCDDPLRQWTIGNEAHFVALDQPSDALGRAYGVPTPTACDLEWYATSEPAPTGWHDEDQPEGQLQARSVEPREDLFSYYQTGVVHGVVEVLSRPNLMLSEAPAARWRRSTMAHHLAPPRLEEVVAHTGLRAPFRFPDGATIDWVVGAAGWRALASRR